jgi:acetoacetyl-CoA synthetase
VLYEEAPAIPGAVWEVAARTGAQVMLLGRLSSPPPPAPASPQAAGYDLSRLRHVMVSGSALPAAGYHWVMEHVSPDLRIDSTSGGTDISGAFVGANEYAPVQVGRIGGRLAGVDCAAWDEDGKPVVDSVGDLVVTQPMPSMPVYLWNDPDAVRHRVLLRHLARRVAARGLGDDHSEQRLVRPVRTDLVPGRAAGQQRLLRRARDHAGDHRTLVIGIELPTTGTGWGCSWSRARHALDDALKHKIVTTLRTRLNPSHTGRDPPAPAVRTP